MRSALPRRALTAAAALPAAPTALRAQPSNRVRITPDWAFHAPNAFAIAAREPGFFREAGLDVTVDRGQGSGGVPVSIAAGTPHFLPPVAERRLPAGAV